MKANVKIININDEELNSEEIISECAIAFSKLPSLSIMAKVEIINNIRAMLHEYSPFKNEPVDFVKWVSSNLVQANDYNPNSVAPPEMELLRVSIVADGYTQPIVTNKEDDKLIVIDGFHRNRVGKECDDVRQRVFDYLPIVQVRTEQTELSSRMASTIRHNRARGKHRVEGMSDIVIELKRRNWSDERICRELGMDQDEVLRLCQITGLAELFSDQEFSKSWSVEGEITESDFIELSEQTDETETFRTVNTSDKNRIFHTHEKWECYKAGFYATKKDGMTKDQCQKAYCDFLANISRFKIALNRVITEWKYSCEHYLTNTAMNRIAWLGQAAMCIDAGIPSEFRSGYFLLTEAQQEAANLTALEYLNKWLVANDRPELTLEEASSYERQSDIY